MVEDTERDVRKWWRIGLSVLQIEALEAEARALCDANGPAARKAVLERAQKLGKGHWPGVEKHAGIVVVAGTAYAMLWTPAMALVSRTIERRGYDQAAGFGLMSAAWPPGFAVGAAAGGTLAGATRDAWPYLLAAAACLLSLPLLGRAASATPGRAQ